MEEKISTKKAKKQSTDIAELQAQIDALKELVATLTKDGCDCNCECECEKEKEATKHKPTKEVVEDAEVYDTEVFPGVVLRILRVGDSNWIQLVTAEGEPAWFAINGNEVSLPDPITEDVNHELLDAAKLSVKYPKFIQALMSAGDDDDDEAAEEVRKVKRGVHPCVCGVAAMPLSKIPRISELFDFI